MKVLVTGGAGFIGSHIVEYWLSQGAEVIVIDNFRSSNPDFITIKNGKDDFVVSCSFFFLLKLSKFQCFKLSSCTKKILTSDKLKSLI